MKHGRNEAGFRGRGRVIAVCSPLLLSVTLLRCAQGDNDQAPGSGADDDGAVAQVDARSPAEDARPARDEDAAAPDAQTKDEAAASGDEAGQSTADDAPSGADAQETPDAEGPPEDAAEDSGVDAAPAPEDSGIDAPSTPDAGEIADTSTSLDASDAAAAPDVYEAGTSVDASDAAAHDSGVDAAADASSGGNCAGIPAWVEGTTAQVVTNLGSKYTCITPGWCSLVGTSAVLAYEPGTGSAWQEAWTDDGPCN